MVSAATTAAITIVRGSDGDRRRAELVRLARRFRAAVPGALGDPDCAIAPIRIGDDRRVMAISRAVIDAGVFVQGIRPPTVPAGTARLRVSLSAAHDDATIDHASVILDNATRHHT
jgi:8-amino-7-oxononanoate synthase